jgi:HSP20 family protein
VKWKPCSIVTTRDSRWPRQGSEAFLTPEWSPKVDIVESAEAFTIKAELPEVNKEDIKVDIENGELRRAGERRQEKEEKGKKFHRIERSYGSFMRSFTLPDYVDEANIKASFADGMLKLWLPKTAPTQSA